jgi:hypothetical protein
VTDFYDSHQAAIDAERDATDRLSRLHGPAELQAALLALLVPAGSRRAARAWRVETLATPGVRGLLEQAACLSGAARLPWFEQLLSRMALQPIAARRELLQAARRMMGARGRLRPLDLLHWLAMRRALGEVAPVTARPEGGDEVAEWLESDVLALASYTAYLARIIPAETIDGTLGAAGASWYANVMGGWQPHTDASECHPPDSEGTVRALRRLQTLSLMQRPVVIRSWVAAAIKACGGARLGDLAADALRLSCLLLDSPRPPELERHYVAIEDAKPK